MTAPTRLALLAVLAVALNPATASAAKRPRGPTAPVVSSAPFWDDYVVLRGILRTDPDSALGRAEARRAIDPDDFLGAWVQGAYLSRSGADSLLADEVLREASANPPERAALQVTAGTILLDRGSIEEGRAALDRAHDAYVVAGRSDDACRSVLWKSVLRTREKPDAAFDADLALAVTTARSIGEPATIADALMAAADRERQKSFPSAIRLRKEAMALLSARPPAYQLMWCHRGLGLLLSDTGDLDGAQAEFEKALALSRTLGYRREEAIILGGMGSVARHNGAFTRAIELHTQALEISRQVGDSTALPDRYTNLGNVYVQQGHYRQAREAYDASLRAAEACGLPAKDRVLTIDNIGVLEGLTGNQEASRRRFEEALAICREWGLKKELPTVLNHLAQYYEAVGDAEREEALVEEGLAAAREVGARRTELWLLAQKGRLLREAGDADAAVVIARDVARLSQEADPQSIWDVNRDLALALADVGRGDEAIAVLDSLERRFATDPDSARFVRVLELLGRLRIDRGELEKALPPLTRGLAISRALGMRYVEALVALSLGRARLAMGEPEKAIASLEPPLALAEANRSLLTASEERGGYTSRWYGGYVTYARALAAVGRNDDAFAVLERTRARELRDLFGARTPGLGARVSAPLAAAVAQVETDLSGVQAAILRENANPAGERSEDAARMEREADSLKTVWASLSVQVERESPEFAQAAGFLAPVTAADVRGALEPGERLLAYMTGDDATLLFDFRPGGLNVRTVPWSETRLAAAVDSLAESLRAGRAPNPASDAARLGGALLAGCGLDTDPPRVLYVAPDGPLHHLPFEVLSVGESTPGSRLLVARMPFVYVSSATLLLRPGAQPDAAGPIVALGDPALPGAPPPAAAGDGVRGGLPRLVPLPHARDEVEGIRTRYPDARVFVGAEATEGRFFSEASRARILHVAAHAFVDDQHPKFSGIVLAPSGPGDDGIVQAHEVAERRLDVGLATLSACESAGGRLVRGEGIIGLSRAFRLAGARNLVVSLWRVDDATAAAFMGAFYERLSGGYTPASALQGAKLEFLGGTVQIPQAGGDSGTGEGAPRGVGRVSRAVGSAAPAAWAPFILIGSRDPGSPASGGSARAGDRPR